MNQLPINTGVILCIIYLSHVTKYKYASITSINSVYDMQLLKYEPGGHYNSC